MFEFSLTSSGVAYLGASYFECDIAVSGVDPTVDDLTEIQKYEDLIEADVKAVDAECKLISAVDRFVKARKAAERARRTVSAGAA